MAIANMVARNEHSTAYVLADNGVATIVAGMKELEGNPIVQKNGCFAFAAMASKCSDDERAAIVSAGALQRVFYAMRQYLIVESIQRYGLLALNNLAPPPPSTATPAAAAAAASLPWYLGDESLGALAVTTVLEAMTACPQQPAIQADGCKALHKFVPKSDKNALVALGHAGLRTLLAALPLVTAAPAAAKAIVVVTKLLGVAKLNAVPAEPLDYVAALLRCGNTFTGDENIAKASAKCFELLVLSSADAALIAKAVKTAATDQAMRFVVVVALPALIRQNPANAATLVASQPDAFVDAFITLFGTSGSKALLEQACTVLTAVIQSASAFAPLSGQLKSLAQPVIASQQRLGLNDAVVRPLLALINL